MSLLVFVSGAAFADPAGWTTYKANDYGFSMLVPEGAKVQTKEWGGGWGGLYSEHDGVTLYAVAKLGEPESAEDIEAFGVKLTMIPDDGWTQIDKGTGKGWKWYRTVKATKGSKLAFGGYGVGPKGSYLLILVTTAADFKEHQADYEKWYESIRLN
ncbi:hypothetical protein CfE428DRAFT_0429 [Chthoniobacter flavus Ellin428]|uniref:Uncharacterized protein n=1 Tax=Chthoniobacter flavus Ellin428 TaxID=497964 RepID=B4CUR6_9BACT|nr:hypothetical protein [Chthoniobacter flavus]EDY22304.1 hypothetical protein CfE428DRAFT_0429 [Chthoniobacter flavus Ellin428]TCO94680.1 hypothetical protein EV701_102148 [Chthoniobacter flavus]